MSDLNSPKIFHYNENSATNYEMDGNIYGKSMPQSPTSAVSSETTSETQSVSDEPSQMVNVNRKVKFINSSSICISHVNLPFTITIHHRITKKKKLNLL